MPTRVPASRSFRGWICAALLAVVGTANGCADAQVRAASARIDELEYEQEISLFVRPPLVATVDGVRYKLTRRTHLRVVDVSRPRPAGSGTSVLWLSFRRSCRERACALGFIRDDDGYVLSVIPENVEVYRRTKSRANRLHTTPGEPARTRSGKRVGLTCDEPRREYVIYRPGEPARPRCPRR